MVGYAQILWLLSSVEVENLPLLVHFSANFVHWLVKLTLSFLFFSQCNPKSKSGGVPPRLTTNCKKRAKTYTSISHVIRESRAPCTRTNRTLSFPITKSHPPPPTLINPPPKHNVPPSQSQLRDRPTAPQSCHTRPSPTSWPPHLPPRLRLLAAPKPLLHSHSPLAAPLQPT